MAELDLFIIPYPLTFIAACAVRSSWIARAATLIAAAMTAFNWYVLCGPNGGSIGAILSGIPTLAAACGIFAGLMTAAALPAFRRRLGRSGKLLGAAIAFATGAFALNWALHQRSSFFFPLLFLGGMEGGG